MVGTERDPTLQTDVVSGHSFCRETCLLSIHKCFFILVFVVFFRFFFHEKYCFTYFLVYFFITYIIFLISFFVEKCKFNFFENE